MKKIGLILLCGIILLGVSGCGKEENNVAKKDLEIYKCEYQDSESLSALEFYYDKTNNEYTKVKSYYQVFNVPAENNGLEEYEQIVSKLQKKTNLNLTWKLENNTLYESTEIELNTVNNDFITYIEQVEDKYDITESVENIFYLLKDNVYQDNKIDNEKITSFITENNCKIVE